MRVLIVNVTLAGRSGTETVVRDLALGLKASGHEPMVYSPALGELAREIAAAGVPVVSDLAALPAAPDVVHGNHHVELVAALLRFPQARGVFVCHDRTAYWSAPPRMARIYRYVAVDRYCLTRLLDDYDIAADRTCVIYNAVDTTRFLQRSPLPARPARAAVFSHYAGKDTHLDAIQAACADIGLPLDVFGDASGNSCSAPEAVLGQYDIVFAKARCAIEAMAVGNAVILCDTHGLGPMVTVSGLPNLRAWNFGRRTLRRALEPSAIASEIHRYDPGDARAVSDAIRTQAALDLAVGEYVRLYGQVLREPLPSDTSLEAELHGYLRASAAHIDRLIGTVEKMKEPFRMEPVPDAAAARVVVRLGAVPARVPQKSRFKAAVTLENHGSHTLGSFPPFPVHLSYRWLDAATGAIVVAEGARAEVRPPLHGQHAEVYTVGVVAPEMPGRFRLRVTLVQEWVLWFDTLEPAVADSAEIMVG